MGDVGRRVKTKPPEELFAKDPGTRLDALSRYVGAVKKTFRNRWINLHVHTSESFSFFSSPTEAVWHAYDEEVFHFGINDHYAIDGHGEFRSACGVAGLRAFFSVEAVALDDETRSAKRRYNDPNNPGRIYLVGKGVTRDLARGSGEERIFDGMKQAIRERNRGIVQKMNAHARTKGVELGLGYEDARALTPKGNTTERHVVQAFCEKVSALAKDRDEEAALFETLLGVPVDGGVLDDQAELQTLVRAKLVKSGMPCYVEEDERAFTSIENLVRIDRAYGSVPTYAMMGFPVTEEERDLDALFAKLPGMGLYALDLFEFRTPLARASEIVDLARARGLAVFVGTEHNTKTESPLTGEIGQDPGLYPYLKRSADFLMGHQILGTLCDFGYLDEGGRPRIGNLVEGFRLFADAGAREVTAGEIEELKRKGLAERRRHFGL